MAKKHRAPSAPPIPSAPAPAGGWSRPAAAVWRRCRDFAGLGGATYLWPRWLMLRAVGLVYCVIFAGILVEGQALVGPRGIVPVSGFLAEQLQAFSSVAAAWFHAPSLFWIGSGPAMITLLTWLGLVASAALVLNWCPRLALAICWVVFLSFVSTWREFSPAQLDNLMLEAALLAIPFAPAGWRPGLGAASPPHPLALGMMRWLLIRVMFESGLVKLTAGDPHWRNLTAMEVMYETSPFPTALGYLDHHLPHAYHLGEIALTFAAELLAPLLAVFGGRRGRGWALALWAALQAGIQLTNNFGWLNLASIGLGLVLLDDQMFAVAARKIGFGRFASAAAGKAPPPVAGWRMSALRTALWMHFALTLFYFAKVAGVPVNALPPAITAPVAAAAKFHSANGYSLYATFERERYQVEFEGSNDGGRTWRTYPYRFMPQREDRICPFIAPWFPRFEATLEIAAWSGRKSPLYSEVASRLLQGEREVVALFANDPFPDRPPGLIRMPAYRFTFTSAAVHARTGRYWHKDPAGEYLPMLYRDPQGRIEELDLTGANAALRAGDFPAARAAYERLYELGNSDAGFRLAEMAQRGLGTAPDPSRVFALYTELAARGGPAALHNLGVCYEYGVGVEPDYGKAAALYRKAGARGYVFSLYNLGGLYARERLQPPDDVGGLALVLEAETRAKGDNPAFRPIREDQLGHALRLKARMTPAQIAEATRRAAERTER